MPMDIQHGLELRDLIHIEISNYKAFLLFPEVFGELAPVGPDDAGVSAAAGAVELPFAELPAVDAFLIED